MDDSLATGIEPTIQQLLHERPFGRKDESRELQQLTAAYTRLCCGSTEHTQPELVLLTGDSGTGKTTLSKDLKRYVASTEVCGGVFIAGKYDPLHNRAPFSGLVSAFGDFASQMAAESRHVQQSFREAVEANENVDLGLLVNVVPNLQKLFEGGFSDESSDSPIQSEPQKQRVRFMFTEFLRVLTNFRPIVMFLDDLQWCDQDSLDFLGRICRLALARFMILVACRGNEVSVRDPLSRCLRSMESDGVAINVIELRCLDQPMVNELLSSSFGLQEDETGDLSALVFSVTKGNFFYMALLINELHLEKALYYDRGETRWRWGGKKLNLPFRGSIDLLRRTMERMSDTMQAVLKTAASIGTTFSVKVVQLILPSTDVERALEELSGKTTFVVSDQGKGKHRFSHDQVQEAAYSMIPESERPAFHSRILGILWDTDDESGVHWSYAVGQLTKCVSEIEKVEDREKAASLLLKAGRRAASSSGFGTSLSHLTLGIDVLGERRWGEHYDLCLALHNLASEVSYGLGDLSLLDSLTKAVFLHARRYEDKTLAYSVKIMSLGSTGQLQEAFKLGFRVLSELGEKFQRPSKPVSLVDVLRTRMACRKLSADDLLNLPLMADEKKLAAMRIMNLLFIYAKIGEPDLVIPLAVRMVKLTLRHGLSAISACGFAMFAIVLASGILFVRDVDEAYALSKLSVRLLNKFERTKRQWLPRVYFGCYAIVFPWKEPIADVSEALLTAYKVGMKTGDMQYGLLAAATFIMNNFYCGTPLHRIDQKITTVRRAAQYFKQDLVDVFFAQDQQFIANLVGDSDDVYTLTGRYMDESDANRENFNARHIHYLYKAWIALLMGNWDLGEESLNKLTRPEAAFRSPLGRSTYCFLSAMFAVALLRRDGRNRKRYSTFKRNFRIIQKFANRCPTTYFPMQLMMEAEGAAHARRFDDATLKYMLTMNVGSKNTTFLCEGLAASRLGHTFDVERGNSTDAREYYAKARSVYEAWGANVVVDRLTVLITETEAGTS